MMNFKGFSRILLLFYVIYRKLAELLAEFKPNGWFPVGMNVQSYTKQSGFITLKLHKNGALI